MSCSIWGYGVRLEGSGLALRSGSGFRLCCGRLRTPRRQALRYRHPGPHLVTHTKEILTMMCQEVRRRLRWSRMKSGVFEGKSDTFKLMDQKYTREDTMHAWYDEPDGGGQVGQGDHRDDGAGDDPQPGFLPVDAARVPYDQHR